MELTGARKSRMFGLVFEVLSLHVCTFRRLYLMPFLAWKGR